MNLNARQKLVVILGPTSSGKTGLARALCKEFGGYVISADSRQVYRYMDIGTGKADTREELRLLTQQRHVLDTQGNVSPDSRFYILNSVIHFMIDFVDPREEFNVALYKRDVERLMSKVKSQKSKVLFLVGGTGQYIDAVVDNWQFPEGEPNDALRRELEERVKTEGLEVLWDELTRLDPECAEFVQKGNPRRVARALEYVLSTGKKFSAGQRKGERQFEVLKIGITLPREELYKKIDERVDARLAIGMVEEVWNLHTEHNLSWERLHQFGLEYRIIGEWLATSRRPPLKSPPYEGGGGYQDMAQRLKWAIHDYARRQLTWFRRDKEVRWVADLSEAKEYIYSFRKSL